MISLQILKIFYSIAYISVFSSLGFKRETERSKKCSTLVKKISVLINFMAKGSEEEKISKHCRFVVMNHILASCNKDVRVLPKDLIRETEPIQQVFCFLSTDYFSIIQRNTRCLITNTPY